MALLRPTIMVGELSPHRLAPENHVLYEGSKSGEKRGREAEDEKGESTIFFFFNQM